MSGHNKHCAAKDEHFTVFAVVPSVACDRIVKFIRFTVVSGGDGGGGICEDRVFRHRCPRVTAQRRRCGCIFRVTTKQRTTAEETRPKRHNVTVGKIGINHTAVQYIPYCLVHTQKIN